MGLRAYRVGQSGQVLRFERSEYWFAMWDMSRSEEESDVRHHTSELGLSTWLDVWDTYWTI